MKIDTTTPSLDLDKVITWQYDQSPRFVSMIQMMDRYAEAGSSSFITKFIEYVISINNSGGDSDPFSGAGLNIWGEALGFPRPIVNGNPIGDDAYRRILVARMRMMFSDATGEATRRFMYDVFGGGASLIDNMDMSVTLVADSNAIDDADLRSLATNSEIGKILELPAGVGIGGNKIVPSGIFGLNVSDKSEGVGQNLENFAVSQSSGFGGTFNQ